MTLTADICYIDMRNLHRLIDMLAPALEDAHFFIYSEGDAFDHWADEIRIHDGHCDILKWTVGSEDWIDFAAVCAELSRHPAGTEAYERLATLLPDR